MKQVFSKPLVNITLFWYYAYLTQLYIWQYAESLTTGDKTKENSLNNCIYIYLSKWVKEI